VLSLRSLKALAIGALILGVSSADAQPRDAADAQQALQELGRVVDSQRRLIEEQSRRLDELQRQLDEVRALMVPSQSPSSPPTVSGASQETRRQQKWPELPPDVVTAGDFPGSFQIPDSNAAVKVGGLVRANWVTTLDPLQVSDRFITADIPVDVTDAPVGRRVDVIAIPSRFNLDFRTPTGGGYVRAFIEGDFGGSGNVFRLRHAYGQWRHLIFGQTWSTFSDPEAEPDTIDFEGLNAMIHFRQPEIRWTWPATKRLRVALALEDPDVEITGATAANQLPDFVARLRWESERGTHVQAGVVVREIRGFLSDTPADIVGAQGWGVSASGRLPSPFGSDSDRVLFQVTRGAGIGHYVTDLNSLGGQDGVYDTTTNAIRVLPVSAGFFSYEHYWSDRIHSAFTAGVVKVNTLDIQPTTAYQRTSRYSGNFIWEPVPRLELVAELLYGVRVNKDAHRLRARQLQVGGTFRF
jgi:uncharacterized coiled-coil protein SlyX